MIALFTDFGLDDPYVGQLHAVLAQTAPGVPCIDLFHHVPAFDVRAGAYLLPALARGFSVPTVFLCVVDPGVGGERRPIMLQADAHWYVGPDNGLFTLVARRAATSACYAIQWRPAQLSASFHGRDLFAPCAARLACGARPDAEPCAVSAAPGHWPDDLAEVVYVDRYGNAVTGLRAGTVAQDRHLRVHGRRLPYARVFSAAPHGASFWYENSMGLIEIAAHQASAAGLLGLRIGDAVAFD
jgi:S-adenosylmethionine hydrolase